MKVIKHLEMNYRKVSSTGSLDECGIRVTEYLRMTMQEFINKTTRCVTIFDNISDYKYSIISTEYTRINPVDVVGRIVRIDWDTMEIELEIDDKYGDESGAYYIAPNEWDLYLPIIRGRIQMDYEKIASGEDVEYATVIELFGIDLVRMEFSKTE